MSALSMTKQDFSNLTARRKMKIEEFSDIANVSEQGVVINSMNDLQKIASRLGLPVTELLPSKTDLNSGLKVNRAGEGYRRTEIRNGKKYYTYTHLANSNTAPELMSLHLTLHCNSDEAVSLNGGHGSKEFVYVLNGRVKVFWQKDEKDSICFEILEKGDSVYLQPGISHSFHAVGQEAEILAVNF